MLKNAPITTYHSAGNRWGFDSQFNYRAFPKGGDFDYCSILFYSALHNMDDRINMHTLQNLLLFC